MFDLACSTGARSRPTANPQDFYYDSATSTYDLIAYYAQREFAEPRELQFVEPSVGRQAYILPREIKPRGALTIRTNSRLSASLPVDISWDTANLTDENPFNPFVEGVNVGGAWNQGLSSTSNYGPKNLKASIYTFPLGRTDNTSRFYAYKIGEIPLKDPNPEGTTQSANLPITENVKRYFTWPSSENYIEGDSRLFQE